MGPIKPGDRFLRVQKNDHRQNSKSSFDWIVVTKIGRLWATFYTEDHPEKAWMGGRFDQQTMKIDGKGFSSPGVIYRDEADYQVSLLADTLWREFWKKLEHKYQRPPGLTQLAILKAADALGIRLEAE